MKKILVLICALLSFNFVSAEESAPVFNKNLYAFDEVVNVDGAYDGIGFIFGSNVNIGSTLEYGAVMGANVYLRGEINKDLFAFGSNIDISGSILRDAYIAGSTVKINGTIDGNLYVSSEELIIGEDAKISGDVKFYGSTFKTNGGSILGTLSYYEDTIYDGETKYDESIMVLEDDEFSFVDYLKELCTQLLSSLFVFALIAFGFPKLFNKIKEKYELNDAIGFLSLCGSGLIYMFILPVVSCMLIISSIGMSAGFILLALIFVLMYLSNLFFGYILGNLICKLLKQEYNVYLSGLFGITLITVLSYIPYINVVVNLVSVCSGFGILVKLITDKENRK